MFYPDWSLYEKKANVKERKYGTLDKVASRRKDRPVLENADGYNRIAHEILIKKVIMSAGDAGAVDHQFCLCVISPDYLSIVGIRSLALRALDNQIGMC